MNIESSRQRVRRAREELELAEQELGLRWRPWGERIRRNKVALLMTGGLLSGAALATLPTRIWSRFGAVLFGGGAWLARSKLTPALVGAFLVGLQTAPAAGQKDAAAHSAESKP